MVVTNGLVTPLHQIENSTIVVSGDDTLPDNFQRSFEEEISQRNETNKEDNFQRSFEEEISQRNTFDPDNKNNTPETEILKQIENFRHHISNKPPKVLMGSNMGLEYAPSYLTEFERDPSLHNNSILIKKKRTDVFVDLNNLTGRFIPDNNRFIVKTVGELDEPLVNVIRKIDGDINKKFNSTIKGFKGYEKTPIVTYHRGIYTDPSIIHQRQPDMLKGEKIISRVYN